MRIGKTLATTALSFLLVVGLAGTALAAQNATDGGITPTLITGTSNNASLCSVLYPGTTELKVNAPFTSPHELTDGTLTVKVIRPSTSSTTPTTDNSIDWEHVSGPDVVAVIVKDGVDGANNYNYQGSTLA